MSKEAKRKNKLVVPLPTSEERVAYALKWFRMSLGFSRTEFGKTIGLSKERVASYEDARARLPWEIYCRVAALYGLNPRWLAVGGTDLFAPFDERLLSIAVDSRALFLSTFQERISHLVHVGQGVPPPSPKELKDACQKLLDELRRYSQTPAATREKIVADRGLSRLMLRLFAQVKFALQYARDTGASRGWEVFSQVEKKPVHGGQVLKSQLEILIPEGRKELLTKFPKEYFVDAMDKEQAKRKLEALLGVLRRKTEERGMRKKLAAAIGVSPGLVSSWLSGKKIPDGLNLLLLQAWAGDKQ